MHGSSSPFGDPQWAKVGISEEARPHCHRPQLPCQNYMHMTIATAHGTGSRRVIQWEPLTPPEPRLVFEGLLLLGMMIGAYVEPTEYALLATNVSTSFCSHKNPL